MPWLRHSSIRSRSCSANASRYGALDAIAEHRDADRVALLEQEPGERRRDGAGVFPLGQRAATVGHRSGGVDQQRRAQVGLVLEAFHVELVGLGVELPVDEPDL